MLLMQKTIAAQVAMMAKKRATPITILHAFVRVFGCERRNKATHIAISTLVSGASRITYRLSQPLGADCAFAVLVSCRNALHTATNLLTTLTDTKQRQMSTKRTS